MQLERLDCSAYQLTLVRLPAPELLEPLWRLASDPDVSAHMEWAPHRTIADTESFFADCEEERRDGRSYHFAAVRATDAATLGVASLFDLDARLGRGEVTTWLGKEHWGQGLNKKVKHLIFELAFGHLGLRKVVMRVAADNRESIRSHAKLHTRLEGALRDELLVRGERVDCLYYGLLAAEYEAYYGRLDVCLDRGKEIA